MSGPQAGQVLTTVITAQLRLEVPFRYNLLLLDDVLGVLKSSLAANTSKGYKTGLASYVRWTQDQGIPIQESWPATDLLVAAWAVSCCVKHKIGHQSFKMYMRGLKYYHVQLRLDVSGFESSFTRSYLMGLRKAVRNSQHKKKRWPITIPQLRRILGTLDPNVALDALKGLIYSVGFFGGPRPSEYLKKVMFRATDTEDEIIVHPLVRWTHVEVKGASPHRTASIRVLGAKYDPDDLGYLMVFRETRTLTCVLKWLTAHAKHRKKNNTKDDYLPLFALKKEAVTVEKAKSWLKQDARQAGLCHEHYTSYSLRRGLATTLFLLGAKTDVIKRMGRWRSDAYKQYVQIDPATTSLWRDRARKAKFDHFGVLTLDQAAQLTLSSVDKFYKSWNGRLKK